MRCPACGFVSFPHLTACKKCGKPLPAPSSQFRMPSPPQPAPPKAASPAPAPAVHGQTPPRPAAAPGGAKGEADTVMLGAAAAPGGRVAQADTVMLDGSTAAPPSSTDEETFKFTLPTMLAAASAPPREQFGSPAGLATQLDFRPAGFWIRFVAALVDGFVLWVLTLILAIPLGLSGGFAIRPEDLQGSVQAIIQRVMVISVVNNLVSLLYFVVFVGWRGQTPGKILLGLKIIRVDGGEVDYVKAFIRWIGYWISAFILLIGYIMAAFTENKRALHDYIAGTRVVRL